MTERESFGREENLLLLEFCCVKSSEVNVKSENFN